MDIVDKAIESEKLSISPAYKKWKAKIAKKKRPKDPLKPKKASAPQGDLVMAIQKRVLLCSTGHITNIRAHKTFHGLMLDVQCAECECDGCHG